MKELIAYTKEMIAKYPYNTNDIESLFELCVNEIMEGGSEPHEIQLCMEDIRQICEDTETSDLLERLRGY